jgi:CII-binding regulator of phage lambda lysogenization HflD
MPKYASTSALGDGVESVGVSLRLSKDVWVRYSCEAMARSMSLGALLRLHLESRDEYLGRELAELRRRIEQVAVALEKQQAGSTSEYAAHLEMLILLRSLAGPERSGLAAREVERTGLPLCR